MPIYPITTVTLEPIITSAGIPEQKCFRIPEIRINANSMMTTKNLRPRVSMAAEVRLNAFYAFSK